MEITNLLHFGTRPELHQWLKENHSNENSFLETVKF